MFSSRIITALSLMILLASCATNQSKPNRDSGQHLSQEQIQELNQQAIDKVSNRLKELSLAAKASGPDKVRFLASDMYLKASAALMEGDFQTANIIFKHLLTLTPDDDFVKRKYAISLIRTGELDISKKLLEEVFVNSKQKDSEAGLVLAGVYASLGETNNSRIVYKNILKHDAKNEEACIFLGKSYALEKKTAEAIRLLKGCEAKNPKKGIYSYYMGKIYVDKKDYKTAMKFFQNAQRREKDFSQATIGQGLIHEELGQVKQAKAVYKKYLKTQPNDTLVLGRLVQLMFMQEEFVEVIDYAERLSDYEPENLNLKVKLGILYKDVKKYNKAVQIFKDLLAVAPDNDNIIYYLGAIFQEMKQYDSSIEYFAKVRDTSGLYQDSSLQIAQMLSLMAQTQGNEEDEEKYSKRFLSFIDSKIDELKTFKVDFSVIKASYFENIDQNEEAIAALEAVAEDKSFNIDHKFYLAALYEKIKEFNDSEKIVLNILKTHPENAHAWNFLGYSYLERGVKMDRAYEFIAKAVKLSPKDGYIRDSLGWYYFKTGKLDLALTELRAAIKSEPGDISINKHLAVVYTSLNDFKKAKHYIKKALSVVQGEKERAELIEVLKDLEQKRIPASFSEIK